VKLFTLQKLGKEYSFVKLFTLQKLEKIQFFEALYTEKIRKKYSL